MKTHVFFLAFAALLFARSAAACEPVAADTREAAPSTVTEGVMATFELTRTALRRQAYLDCIRPELPTEQPKIELEKLDVEFDVDKDGYAKAGTTVASN